MVNDDRKISCKGIEYNMARKYSRTYPRKNGRKRNKTRSKNKRRTQTRRRRVPMYQPIVPDPSYRPENMEDKHPMLNNAKQGLGLGFGLGVGEELGRGLVDEFGNVMDEFGNVVEDM